MYLLFYWYLLRLYNGLKVFGWSFNVTRYPSITVLNSKIALAQELSQTRGGRPLLFQANLNAPVCAR